jgi:hypothetical protein
MKKGRPPQGAAFHYKIVKNINYAFSVFAD